MIKSNLFETKRTEIKNKVLYLKLKSQGYIYECCGVYINETEDKIELAFNAVNDKVLDAIQFNKSDIIEMKAYEVLKEII